jgi:Mu-like prophage protein gp29
MAKKNTIQKPDEGALIPKLQAPYRGSFDIQRWRNALQRAEDPIYPDWSLLYDIYNDIMLDTHLTAVIEKRVEHIKGTPLRFVDKGKENQDINWLIEAPWFTDMLGDILEARFWHYSAAWLDLSGKQYNKYRMLPRKHILPEKGLFVKRQGDRTGTSIITPPYSNYIITAGNPDEMGLLLKMAPWVLLKRGDVSDWATFNEIYAAPIRKGTYPLYDEPAKKALFEAIVQAGGFGAFAHPNGTTLEFVQANAAGSVATYQGLADFCDKQMSKAGLLNTMTLDAEGGQYKGDVHQESEKLVLQSDRRFVLAVLNTSLWELLNTHGFNPGTGKFIYVNEERIPLKERIEIDLKVAGQVEVPPEYWYETYNIPVPKGGPKAVPRVAPISLSDTDPEPPALEPTPNRKKGLRDFFV